MDHGTVVRLDKLYLIIDQLNDTDYWKHSKKVDVGCARDRTARNTVCAYKYPSPKHTYYEITSYLTQIVIMILGDKNWLLDPDVTSMLSRVI